MCKNPPTLGFPFRGQQGKGAFLSRIYPCASKNRLDAPRSVCRPPLISERTRDLRGHECAAFEHAIDRAN
jgi:hypothetical protein